MREEREKDRWRAEVWRIEGIGLERRLVSEIERARGQVGRDDGGRRSQESGINGRKG